MATVAKRHPVHLTVASTCGNRPSSTDSAPGAAFTAEQIGSSLVLIRVRGEIDVLSAPALRAFACARVGEDRHVVLDLSEVDFIGAAGLAVFDTLDAQTCRFGSGWTLVGGRAVQRLLRAADRESACRCYESVEAAMGALRGLSGEGGLSGEDEQLG